MTAMGYASPALAPNPQFSRLLAEFRQHARMTQGRLAETAGFDHSYVSRLESGGRLPTREAVGRLADALCLSGLRRDLLLSSAGFMPGDVESLFADEPVLGELRALLADPDIRGDVQEDVRRMVRLLVQQARRTHRRTGDIQTIPRPTVGVRA